MIGLAPAVALLAPIGGPEQRLAALVLALAAVGVLATRLVLPSSGGSGAWDAVDRLPLATAFAAIVSAGLAGAVFAATRRLDSAWLLTGLIVLLAVLAIWSRGARGAPRGLSRGDASRLLILVALAGPLRLVALGFSEYQGDEASVLNRAAALVHGVDQAWLAHKKGPGEILLTAFFGQIVGRVAESDARFPFSLISVAGVLALYATGRAMFDARAGFIAASLWALNGYAIGMGRIVQYHSIVILFSTTAALCAWRAYAAPAGRGRLLALAIALLAVGALFGFNVATLGLPAVIIAGSALAQRRVRLGRVATGWLLGILVVITSPLVFYGVQRWGNVQRYVGWRIGGGQPFNNLDVFGGLTLMYTGFPYLAATVGLFVLGLCYVGARELRPGPARWVAGAAAAGSALALAATSVLTGAGPKWLALLVWAGLTVHALIAARGGVAWLSLGLGALLPFGMYAFVLKETNTHWLEAFPATLLLVGGVTSEMTQRLPRGLQRVAPALGAAGLLGLGLYPVIHFLPTWPPGTQPPFSSVYRPVARAPRQGGDFGMPHQDGWKALAALEFQGLLPLPYTSNEQSEVTRWYLPTAERCAEASRSYVLARAADRPRTRPAGVVTWRLRVAGRERSVVLDRTESPRASSRITAELSAAWFDQYLARLDRPLDVPQVACPRPMPPVWRLN